MYNFISFCLETVKEKGRLLCFWCINSTFLCVPEVVIIVVILYLSKKEL